VSVGYKVGAYILAPKVRKFGRTWL